MGESGARRESARAALATSTTQKNKVQRERERRRGRESERETERERGGKRRNARAKGEKERGNKVWEGDAALHDAKKASPKKKNSGACVCACYVRDECDACMHTRLQVHLYIAASAAERSLCLQAADFPSSPAPTNASLPAHRHMHARVGIRMHACLHVHVRRHHSDHPLSPPVQNTRRDTSPSRPPFLSFYSHRIDRVTLQSRDARPRRQQRECGSNAAVTGMGGRKETKWKRRATGRDGGTGTGPESKR